MIGLGAQDSYDEALEFVETYGTTSFRMLYDSSFESWRALGVRGQPTSILFDADGRGQFIWYGPFNQDEVLDLSAGF